MRHTLFISDLHLDTAYPDRANAFFHFLSYYAPRADTIYILGDLFDLWLGDDDHSAFSRSIITALNNFCNSNIPVYVMRGNHDFMLGKKFVRASGIRLINDPCVIELYNKSILLTHGDALCTDDIAHQKFRKIYTNVFLRYAALKLPRCIRQFIANKIKDKNPYQKNERNEPFNTNRDAVRSIMEKHNVQYLIHGHTHRPEKYTLNIKEQAAECIVLGAWHHEGHYLAYYENGEFNLKTFPLNEKDFC